MTAAAAAAAAGKKKQAGGAATAGAPEGAAASTMRWSGVRVRRGALRVPDPEHDDHEPVDDAGDSVLQRRPQVLPLLQAQARHGSGQVLGGQLLQPQPQVPERELQTQRPRPRAEFCPQPWPRGHNRGLAQVRSCRRRARLGCRGTRSERRIGRTSRRRRRRRRRRHHHLVVRERHGLGVLLRPIRPRHRCRRRRPSRGRPRLGCRRLPAEVGPRRRVHLPYA
ncbi:unnamed protein product [Ectocarpus sp. 12 AP-2014]